MDNDQLTETLNTNSGNVHITAEDQINWARVAIYIHDDEWDNADDPYTYEWSDLTIDGQSIWNWTNKEVDTAGYDWVIQESAYSDHNISVTLQTYGYSSDFTVTSIFVYGDFTDIPVAQPVPEPATMLLLGTGLVGLVRFRKRFKK